MFFSTRKELKSCGVYASSVYKQGSSFKNCGVCIKRLSTRKEFKFLVSMHHVFIKKEAV